MKGLFIPLALVTIMASVSCVSVKPVQYLEGRTDTTILNTIPYREPVIEPGDLISILVLSENPTASALYNQGGGSIPINTSGADNSSTTGTAMAASSAPSSQPGYLVTEDGNIIMPGLGPVHVAGFTKKKLADSLTQYFLTNDLLKNPACDIRFLNFKITVLGEVQHPGQFSIPGNKVTVLEALGLAGDFTVWSIRDNVTIIRDNDGKRVLGKLDLTTDNIFSSPFFYLKQNDIVIVDAKKRKQQATDLTTLRYVTMATSVVSAMAILITVLRN